MDVTPAADSLWEQARRGVYYPPEWRDRLTLEDGYRVQLAHLDRHVGAGGRQAGWKVGLTARSIREQLGVHEPVFGYLLESGSRASGARFRVADLVSPVFEAELCLTVDCVLRGPGITPAQARRCLSAAAPAFELVEQRGDFARDLALALADNAQQKAFITGPALSPLPPGLDLSRVAVEVFINGKRVDGATGREVLGNPAASVAWLANRLADFGRAIEPGMRIMSGSFTRQHPLSPGDTIEARFDPVGAVAAEFG